MKTASKKLLSLLLAAVMIMTMLPFAAFASEATHVCSEATTGSLPGGYWECTACGLVYTDAACTSEPMTMEQYAEQYAQTISAAAAQQNTEENTEENTTQQTAQTQTAEPAQQTLNEVEASPNPAELGTTDVAWVQFVIRTSDGYDIETAPVKYTGTLGGGYSSSKFTKAFKAQGLDPDDYVLSNLTYFLHDGGAITDTPYPANRSVNLLIDDASLPTTSEGVYVFIASVKHKQVKVTLQAKWKVGSTTKTYTMLEDIVDRDASSQVIDYLNNYTQMVSGKPGQYEVIGAPAATLYTEHPELKNNYTWNGLWYVDGNKVVAKKFTSDMVVVANFTAGDCTIKFDANGGTCKVDQVTVPVNKAYDKLPSVTPPDGKIFVGWFSEKISPDKVNPETGRVDAGTNTSGDPIKQYFTSTVITGDTELYAAFVPEAEIKVNVYHERSDTATADVAYLTGVPVGAKVTTDMLKKVVKGTVKAGPFNNAGAVTENNSWAWFVDPANQKYYTYTIASAKASEDVAFYGPSLTVQESAGVTVDYNKNPGVGVINDNYIAGAGNSAYAGNSSTSSADPSNPKTGDQARFAISAAQIALVTSGVALMAIASAAYVQKKKEM